MESGSVGDGAHLEGGADVHHGELQVTSHELQVTSYKSQVTSYKLQATAHLEGGADVHHGELVGEVREDDGSVTTSTARPSPHSRQCAWVISYKVTKLQSYKVNIHRPPVAALAAVRLGN